MHTIIKQHSCYVFFACQKKENNKQNPSKSKSFVLTFSLSLILVIFIYFSISTNNKDIFIDKDKSISIGYMLNVLYHDIDVMYLEYMNISNDEMKLLARYIDEENLYN